MILFLTVAKGKHLKQKAWDEKNQVMIRVTQKVPVRYLCSDGIVMLRVFFGLLVRTERLRVWVFSFSPQKCDLSIVNL